MTTETVFRRLKKYCRAQIAWSEKQLANPFEDLGKRGRREHGAGWKGEHRGTIATAQELIDEIHLLRQEHRKKVQPERHAIAQAAQALVDHLRQNVGDTADWPLSIVSDDPQVATRTAELLTNLDQCLRSRG